jgi:hypothetical protein
MIDMAAVKTLEARHDFLLVRSPHIMNKKSFASKELKALGEATAFIRWMFNNTSDAMVRKTLEKYQQENAAKIDAPAVNPDKIAAYNAKNALLDRALNVFHETSSRTCKIQIILSEDAGVDFIQMERIRRIPETLLWRRVSYIKLSLYKLEKILKKAQAIMKIKKGEDPEKVSDTEFLYNFLSRHPLK